MHFKYLVATMVFMEQDFLLPSNHKDSALNPWLQCLLANFQRVPQSYIHWACCAISVLSGTLKITLNLLFHLLFPLGICTSRIFAAFSEMTFGLLADLCSLLRSLKVLFCFPFISLLPLFKVYIERQICALNYGCLKGNPKCNTQFRKSFLVYF